jgi:hypothetical protein
MLCVLFLADVETRFHFDASVRFVVVFEFFLGVIVFKTSRSLNAAVTKHEEFLFVGLKNTINLSKIRSSVLPRIAGVPTIFSTKFIISWSKSQLFFIFHNFMVKINTFFAERWSGPTSADRQGQNTVEGASIFFFVKSALSVCFLPEEFDPNEILKGPSIKAKAQKGARRQFLID